MENLSSIERVIEALSKFPSVGKKSAERMAYSLLDMSQEQTDEIINSIKDMKETIHYCKICGNLSESDICEICLDNTRDKTCLMIVSYPKDILAIERSEQYHGQYFVLNGLIQPNKGIGPEDLNFSNLFTRLEDKAIKEVIIATNPTIDGETTALYIAKILKSYGLNITRLGYGLQMGGNLDYVDSITLSKALEGRTKIK